VDEEMDLRVLRYFMAVVREENIVKAAQSLNVTQPTLSRQLQDLEDELGGELFNRGHRGCPLTLTPRGMKLKRRAEEILELSERTKTEVRGGDDSIQGKIVIGCGESEVMRNLGCVLKNIRTKYEKVTTCLISADADTVSEKLDKGIIDFGVFIGTVDLNRYDYIKLDYKDSWGVLVNKENFDDKVTSISPEDLLNIPLLVSAQTKVHMTFEPWLGYSFSKLKIAGEYNLVHNAAILCEENFSSVLTLDRLVNTKGRNLRFIPLKPAVTSNTYIAWKKYLYLNPLQTLFIDEVKKSCLKNEEE